MGRSHHVYQAVRDNDDKVIRFFKDDTSELKRKMRTVEMLGTLEAIVPSIDGKIEQSFFQGQFSVGYIVDFVQGIPLSEYCGNGLADVDVARLISELLAIAQIFHQQHYVVADFKPDNVVVSGSGKLIYVDVDSVIEFNSTVYFPGSQGYTAPELQDGHPLPSADIFSIGRTALFALTGKRPTLLANEQGVIACPRSTAPRLRNFIERLMALSPIDRPDVESAIQYSQDLPRYIRRWQRIERYKLPVICAAAVLAAILLAPFGVKLYSSILSARGNQLQLREEVETAINVYERALFWNSRNVSAQIGLGIAYSSLSESKKAIVHLQNALAQPLSEEQQGLIRYNLANLYELEDDFPRAIETYLAVPGESSIYVKARNNLARLYVLDSEADQAIQVIEEILYADTIEHGLTDDLKATLLKNLGWAYLESNELSKAKTILADAIALDPLLADSYCLLAEVRRRTEEEFTVDLITCLNLGPTEPSQAGILKYIIEQLN